MKWENLPRGQSLAFPEKKSVLAAALSSGSMSENLVTAALSFRSPSEKEPGDCSPSFVSVSEKESGDRSSIPGLHV